MLLKGGRIGRTTAVDVLLEKQDGPIRRPAAALAPVLSVPCAGM